MEYDVKSNSKLNGGMLTRKFEEQCEDLVIGVRYVKGHFQTYVAFSENPSSISSYFNPEICKKIEKTANKLKMKLQEEQERDLEKLDKDPPVT